MFFTSKSSILHQKLSSCETHPISKSINWLSDYRVRFDPEHARAIEFHTQVPTEQGKPDLAISGIDDLVMIEAKVESEQGPDQLILYAN
jgi:hypothetical protein